MSRGITGRIVKLLFPALVSLGLALGGCASQATNYNADMANVVNVCRQHAHKTALEAIQCYDSNERPIVARDLPNLLYAYEQFNASRIAAVVDYDNRVKLATEKAGLIFQAAAIENRRKLDIEGTPLLPRDQVERQALIQEAKVAAAAACFKDGLW